MARAATLLILIVLAGCTVKQTNTESDYTPEGEAVEELLLQYYEDMSERNWPKYRQHFWDNATITTTWQQPGDSLPSVDVTTIDDFIAESPSGPDSQPVFEEHMLNSKINVEGNIASAWVQYAAKFGKTDSLMQWGGTDVFILLKHEGQWKITSLVFEPKPENSEN